jgi:hypothetical protein
MFLINIFLVLSQSLFATTAVNNPDQGFEPILECVEAGAEECPQVEIDPDLQIEILEVGDTYIRTNMFEYQDEDALKATEIEVSEAGVLVLLPAILTASELEELNIPDGTFVYREARFIPLDKVGVSPDSNYYLCYLGREYRIVGSSIINNPETEVGNSPILLDVLHCYSFWMPQAIYNQIIAPLLDEEEQAEIPQGGITQTIINNYINTGGNSYFSGGNSNTFIGGGGDTSIENIINGDTNITLINIDQDTTNNYYGGGDVTTPPLAPVPFEYTMEDGTVCGAFHFFWKSGCGPVAIGRDLID